MAWTEDDPGMSAIVPPDAAPDFFEDLPDPVFVEILMKADPDTLHDFARASPRVWRLVSPPTFAQWIDGNNKPETTEFWEAYMKKWPKDDISMDVPAAFAPATARGDDIAPYLRAYDEMRQFFLEAEKYHSDEVLAVHEFGGTAPKPLSEALQVEMTGDSAVIKLEIGHLVLWELKMLGMNTSLPFTRRPVLPTTDAIVQNLGQVSHFELSREGDFTLWAVRRPTKNRLYNLQQQRSRAFKPDQD